MDGEAKGTPAGRARGPRDVAAELTTLLWGADRIDEYLVEVARHAAATVEEAVSCGITVQDPTWPRRLAATSEEFARRMDEIQYDVDDGPCLTCLRDGEIVEVTDIAADPRWPAFRRRGRQQGAGASLSIPLRAPGGTAEDRATRAGSDADAGPGVGALNLYTRTAAGFTADARARGVDFAGQVAGAVALAVRLAAGEYRNQHLAAALDSRSTIDRAIGVIMVGARVDAAGAFDVLRRRSQHTNTKLRQVAAQVVAEAVRPR